MPRVQEEMKSRLNDLLSTIKTNPGQSVIHLTAYCSFYFGVSRNTITEYIEIMRIAGLIKVDGNGKVYSIEAVQV